MKNYLNEPSLKTSFTHWALAQHWLCTLSHKPLGHLLALEGPPLIRLLSVSWCWHQEPDIKSLTSRPRGQSPHLWFLQCSGSKVPKPDSMKPLPPQFYSLCFSCIIVDLPDFIPYLICWTIPSYLILWNLLSSQPKPAFTAVISLARWPFLNPSHFPREVVGSSHYLCK